MRKLRRKPRKNYFFIALNGFERWYYKLSYGIRHVVGVAILLAMFATVFGVTYGAYKSLGYAYVWAKEVWQGTWKLDGRFQEYSGSDTQHADFLLSDADKHPNRRPHYQQDFNVVNDVQLSAARRLGIEPQPTRQSLEQKRSQLVELQDTRYYQILPLTSSSPYLVPRAADFLTHLGRLMQEYNGTHSRFLISSVLRTQEDVRRLGQVNTNASKNSAHCYGTTIDITYSRFDVHGNTTEAKLKEDLARALYDMQLKGYCYVMYEVRQPCFHITVRP